MTESARRPRTDGRKRIRWIVIGAAAALVAGAGATLFASISTIPRYEGIDTSQLEKISQVLSGGTSPFFDQTSSRHDLGDEIALTLGEPCRLAQQSFGPWMGFSNDEQWKSNETSGNFTIPMTGTDDDFIAFEGPATEDTEQSVDVDAHLFVNPREAESYVTALSEQLTSCHDDESVDSSTVQEIDTEFNLEAFRWARYEHDGDDLDTRIMTLVRKENLVLIASYESFGSDINDKASINAVDQMIEELSYQD